MIKYNDIVVYIGEQESNIDSPKYGDAFRVKGTYHEKCVQLIDIDLKLPEDYTYTLCPRCSMGVTEAPDKWLCVAEMFRKASDTERMNFEIKESLKAKTPTRLFVINNEDDLKRAMEYGKTYLRAPFTYYFTDNFNFGDDE